MNQRLDALLEMLDKYKRELAASNERYRQSNDRFAAWLRKTHDYRGQVPPGFVVQRGI